MEVKGIWELLVFILSKGIVILFIEFFFVKLCKLLCIDISIFYKVFFKRSFKNFYLLYMWVILCIVNFYILFWVFDLKKWFVNDFVYVYNVLRFWDFKKLYFVGSYRWERMFFWMGLYVVDSCKLYLVIKWWIWLK